MSDPQSTPTPAPRAPAIMHALTPALAKFTDELLFGEIWVRPGLPPRDRSLLTISSLISGGKIPQLVNHLRIALENGLKPSEVSELLTHLAFYTGWPNAVSALAIVQDVFNAQGVDIAALAQPAAGQLPPLVIPATSAELPPLADYADRVINSDLWRRAALTRRDRCLATIAALVTLGEIGQLAPMAELGLGSGLTAAELAEAINHLAFYAGFARAISAAEAIQSCVAA